MLFIFPRIAATDDYYIGTGRITGKVVLQGRGDLNCGGAKVYANESRDFVHADGIYSIYVPPGVYNVRIEMRGYLHAERADVEVLEGRTTELSEVTLLAGDVNDNDVIDIFDLVIVAASFDSLLLEDPRADIDDNGIVNLRDLVLVGSNLGKEPPIPILTATLQPLETGRIDFLYSGWNEEDEEKLRSYVETAYPVIERIYGPPGLDYTVTICNEAPTTPGAGGAYNLYDNKIIMPRPYLPTLVHEMVHAFHDDPRRLPSSGRLTPFPSVWEEGFAEATQALVMRELGEGEGFRSQDLLFYEDWNKACLTSTPKILATPEIARYRYAVRGGAWLKVYFQYNDFFRVFNRIYWQDPSMASHDFKRLFSEVAPTVEGEPFDLWFDRQFGMQWEPEPGYQMFCIIISVSYDKLSLELVDYYRAGDVSKEEIQSADVKLSIYNCNSER